LALMGIVAVTALLSIAAYATRWLQQMSAVADGQ